MRLSIMFSAVFGTSPGIPDSARAACGDLCTLAAMQAWAGLQGAGGGARGKSGVVSGLLFYTLFCVVALVVY